VLSKRFLSICIGGFLGAYFIDFGVYSLLYNVTLLEAIQSLWLQILIACVLELLCFFVGLTLGWKLKERDITPFELESRTLQRTNDQVPDEY